VIVYKAFKFVIHLEEELDLEWVLFYFQKLEKNFLTE